MKKKYIILFLILAVIGTLGSCKNSFLDVRPAGSLDQSVLGTKDGLDALLVGAYSLLDGEGPFGWGSASSNWVYGSIRALEASKGSDAGDQPFINAIQTYTETPTNDYIDEKWREVYEAVSRCNNLIVVTNEAVKSGKVAQADADLYLQQAKALRGWYHFEAWRMWAKVPYLDETTNTTTVTNTDDIGPKIIADITEGTNLPQNMGAVGKWNKTVCEVILAKVLMQINHDYAGAKTLLLDVKANGVKPNGDPIGLAPTYGEIFDIVNRNGIETIYTIQYSANDGSGGMNAGNGEVLNFPYKSGASPGGCCGFFCPTQEFVNSFRTSGGLPLLDFSYNSLSNTVKNDQGIAASDPFTPDAGPLDPRLDWAVGRRGIPYWDWGLMTGADWIRDQGNSGPYAPKKQVYKKSQTTAYTDQGNWTSGFTSNGYRMIRYADLLLLLAECQIETGDIPGGQANINLVRARAANPAGFVKMDDGTNAANYVISQYTTPFADVAAARTALYMERKLELGQEGHRFFDLNRWGITVTELNRALAYEKTLPYGALEYSAATAGVTAVNVSFPIPQHQIDLSNGKLIQNR